MSTHSTAGVLGELGLHRPAWMVDASCAGYAERHGGPARDRIFFPTQGEATRRARAICADCPVNQECLDYALVANMSGIWGGTTQRERILIRRQRRRAGVAG